jgi:hypothetical protein
VHRCVIDLMLQCLPVLRGSGQEASADSRQQKLEMLVQQKSIVSELFESDTIDVCRKHVEILIMSVNAWKYRLKLG